MMTYSSCNFASDPGSIPTTLGASSVSRFTAALVRSVPTSGNFGSGWFSAASFPAASPPRWAPPAFRASPPPWCAAFPPAETSAAAGSPRQASRQHPHHVGRLQRFALHRRLGAQRSHQRKLRQRLVLRGKLPYLVRYEERRV